MDEAIADRVRDGRIGQHLVPSFRRHLGRDDGRGVVVAILQDLEEIALLVSFIGAI